MDSVTLHLDNTDETLELGAIIAARYKDSREFPALLMRGELGAGKTTLVRGLVESLPGAQEAEVSSPSFNILNIYPTRPEVAHFDLYRLAGLTPDDDILDQLEDSSRLAVVEWAEYLEKEFRPVSYLLLTWTPVKTGRNLKIKANGRAAEDFLKALKPSLLKFKQQHAP